MELLQALLPSPNGLQLNDYEMDLEHQHLELSVMSTQTVAPCPLCGSVAHRVHSRYQRTLADLPCLHFSLSLLVLVCKFFCPNPGCRRRIFTERIPEVAAPWARKTVRQVQHLQEIGLALGGAAGSRLGKCLGYFSCGSTVLNHLERLPLPELEVPEVLGVDDFAFRKGRQYGTILVNLETHKPIALLPDRKADTLADWIREHPGVEVFSRDRSTTYKSAINKAAPEAIQVADRFHLVKNLSEVLEIALGSYRAELKAASEAQHPQPSAEPDCAETVVVIPQPTAIEAAQELTRQKHQLRVQQQREIKALREQEWPILAIAEKVGVSERTVRRYSARPDFPDLPPRRPTFGRSLLDPYKQEVVSEWNSGITNSSAMMVLLQQKGYKGSRRTLQRYMRGLRKAQGISSPSGRVAKSVPKVVDPQSPPFTPRQAAYLIVQRDENQEGEDKELLGHLVKQHPDLKTLVDLAYTFLELLRQRQADAFDSWLMEALACPINPLKKFAASLMDDYAEVKASMMMEVSNGPVEGLNNKLKMLKRQM
ncbi:ISL3 family transposase [Acaryochloris marina NIES-2412]|uniref:ISL3 family transposase n=1 Tax=Acaryochloris marina TaxID=155978 RepID=UPI0040592C68